MVIHLLFIVLEFVLIYIGIIILRRNINSKKQLECVLLSHQEAHADTSPLYYISAITGGYEVIRLSKQRGQVIYTIIKQFINDDTDFAFREAQELLDTLES